MDPHSFGCVMSQYLTAIEKLPNVENIEAPGQLSEATFKSTMKVKGSKANLSVLQYGICIYVYC
jgi:hypothetical protein